MLRQAVDLGTSELHRNFMVATLRLAMNGNSTAQRYWFENRLNWRRHKSIEISGVGGGPVEVADMRDVALSRLEQFLRNEE